MRTYFDTSLLLKVYVWEPATPQVLALIRKEQPPLPFSHLLELELRTAIRIKHGRNEIVAESVKGILSAIEKDLADGVLVRPDYELDEVFRRAEMLSSLYAVSTLARSADIWHVAAALESGCKYFASSDQRQRQVAKLSGLKVLP